jgi:hypothetical protein
MLEKYALELKLEENTTYSVRHNRKNKEMAWDQKNKPVERQQKLHTLDPIEMKMMPQETEILYTSEKQFPLSGRET